jgi:hypothetical protein
MAILRRTDRTFFGFLLADILTGFFDQGRHSSKTDGSILRPRSESSTVTCRRSVWRTEEQARLDKPANYPSDRGPVVEYDHS